MKKMWAWHDKLKDEYQFIYPKKFLVEVCSPDGFKSNIERGEGEIIEVAICRHYIDHPTGDTD